MSVLFCEADVKINAKPMSEWMRNRCQYDAKPMSKWMRSRCQNECEADARATAKPMPRRHSRMETRSLRSLCQEECEADASIILRSRCQNECDADATRSHPTCMGHFPTQLARDTFPPNSDGTRSHLTPSHSHPTLTGHVPTQLARNNLPPNSHGTRLRSRCQNECEADVRMNAKPMSW